MKPVIAFKQNEFYTGNNSFSFWKQRRWVMIAVLALSDLLGLFISVTLSVIIWRQVRTDFFLSTYTTIFPSVIILQTAIYSIMGLYPATGLGPVEELRRLTYSTTLLFFGLIVFSFYIRTTLIWSRAIIGLTWFFMVCGLPILRKLTRRIALKLGLWGEPVIVIGSPERALRVTQDLRSHPLSGFLPVLCISASSINHVFPDLIPENKEATKAKALFGQVETLILAPDKDHFKAAKNVLIDKSHSFKRIIVILNEERLGSVWFNNLHLLEYMALEVDHRWNNARHMMIKRLIDFVLTVLAIPLLVPLFLIISVAIMIDSPGNIFYTQARIGKNGKEFKIWKFRSMYSNADELMDMYLKGNPEFRKEWAESFKLKNDPRATFIGKILRTTSLDELPQIWNVLKGEMTLIGPRPIVKEEIPLYGDEFEILKRIVPGVTGLWQISGRNNLPYQERVNLDLYYLQNWSIWLDIHILMHTVLAVFIQQGAY